MLKAFIEPCVKWSGFAALNLKSRSLVQECLTFRKELLLESKCRTLLETVAASWGKKIKTKNKAGKLD